MNGHWKAAPRTQRVVRLALRLARELHLVHSPGKGCQHDFSLKAGNGLPNTAVDAHAEPDVSRGVIPLNIFAGEDLQPAYPARASLQYRCARRPSPLAQPGPRR